MLVRRLRRHGRRRISNRWRSASATSWRVVAPVKSRILAYVGQSIQSRSCSEDWTRRSNNSGTVASTTLKQLGDLCTPETPAHIAAAKVLREPYQRPRPASNAHEGSVRDLANYDRAFGLDDGSPTRSPMPRWPDVSQDEERRQRGTDAADLPGRRVEGTPGSPSLPPGWPTMPTAPAGYPPSPTQAPLHDLPLTT